MCFKKPAIFRWGCTVVSVEALPRLTLVKTSVLMKKHDRFYQWLDAATRLGYQMELWQVPILGFFVRRPCWFFGGKCSRTSACLSFCAFFVAKLLGICELEVKVMWAALLAIQQGFPAPPKQHQQKHASTLNFAERWWKRWIASGWLGVLPYVRTRAWYKNENKIALVIVSGPCDPSGIVM